MERFTSKAPWPDVIPKQHALKQLPLLTQLFDIEPPANGPLTSSEGTRCLVQTLGVITASILPIRLSQFFGQKVIRIWNRRARLQPQVSSTMENALSRKFSPDVARFLQTEIAKEASNVINLAKRSATKNTMTVSLSRLAALTERPGAGFMDLAADINLSSEFWSIAIYNAKVTEHNQFLNKVQTDEGHSRRVLSEMVTSA
jgi:hypothetical protein